MKRDAKGRAQAANVAFVGARTVGTFVPRRGTVSLSLAILFLAFVTASVYARKLPFAVLGLNLGASAVAFLAYAFDKSAARSDRWRTQESTLQIFGLIGGWPGASAAQILLRYKSKKQSFQVVFWVTVVANCFALGWLFSPFGFSALQSILGAARGL